MNALETWSVVWLLLLIDPTRGTNGNHTILADTTIVADASERCETIVASKCGQRWWHVHCLLGITV